MESAAGCQGHGKPLWFWHAWDTVVREVTQENILCPTDWGIWLFCCLWFAGAPAAHGSELSHFPAKPLSQPPRYPVRWNWAGTATSNFCLGQQASTGSDFCKDNHRNSLVWNCCTFSFQYWVKEKRQVCGLSLQILFQDSNCCIIYILVFTCLPCVPTIPLNSLWVFPSSPLHVTVFPNCTNTNKPRVQY